MSHNLIPIHFSLGVRRSPQRARVRVSVTTVCSAQSSGEGRILFPVCYHLVIMCSSAPWRGFWRPSPSGIVLMSQGRRLSGSCRTRRLGWVPWYLFSGVWKNSSNVMAYNRYPSMFPHQNTQEHEKMFLCTDRMSCFLGCISESECRR